MCDDGYYDSGGYTEDFVHHDVVHHDVVHHDYVHHDYCAPHVDFITPGIGIGVGMGMGVGYGYPAPSVNVITPVPSYGPTVMTSYPSPPPMGYTQGVHVVNPPGAVVYTREPEVSCCAYCTIL